MGARFAFNGPFVGLSKDLDPKNIGPGHAADMDNCHTKNGDVRARPGLCRVAGEGELTERIKSLRYVGSSRDYIIATAESSVWIQPYDENLQPTQWTTLLAESQLATGSGAIVDVPEAGFGFDRICYIAYGQKVYKFLGKLGDLSLKEAGMEGFDPDQQGISASDDTSGNFHDDVTIYVSRYNPATGVESVAVQLDALSSLSSATIEVEITNMGLSLTGDATHVRIYGKRNTGRGTPGLIAEAEIDLFTTAGTFTYPIPATFDNGGATYSLAADDTNYALVPCTQNGVPPESVDMEYHQGRMFYLTSDRKVYVSQSIDEIQGGVEAVSADGFRVIDGSGRMVALKQFRDALYVFTSDSVYRISGTVATLTNEQVVFGSDAFDDPSNDVIEKLEGAAGCVGRDSIIEVDTPQGNFLMYAGRSHIYIFDGVNAYPISLNTVQAEYVSRMSAAGRDGISAAQHTELNCVVFCFKDVGLLVYDYVSKAWWAWDTIVDPLGAASTEFGPVATRSIRQVSAADCIILRQDGSGEYRCCFFTSVKEDDEGQTFTPTWTGPNFDYQVRERKKNWLYLSADFRKQSTGTVTLAAHISGDSSLQVPATPISWPQNKMDVARPKVRIGARAYTAQPVFTLAGNSVMTGYVFEATPVGRR